MCSCLVMRVCVSVLMFGGEGVCQCAHMWYEVGLV